MTTDQEMPEQYRNDLEHRIKDLFIWALGESVKTETTRTVEDNNPNTMDKSITFIAPVTLYSRTKQISKPNGITREKNEAAEGV